jgi:hypothetical protein
MTKRYGLSSEQVIGRWMLRQESGTAAAGVPGGRRVSSTGPRIETNGGSALYSYATVVAVANRDGSVALTPARYSVTTSKLMGKVRRLLTARGYEPTTETQAVWAKHPGRWGGFGPAWAPTAGADLPFEVWRRRPAPATVGDVDRTNDGQVIGQTWMERDEPKGLGVFGDRCECGQALGH